MTQEEKRAYPRVFCNLLPSDLRVPQNLGLNSSFFSEAKDISPLGIRLIVPHRIPVGSRLALSITLPTFAAPKYKNVTIGMSVAWIAGTKEIGKFEIGGPFDGVDEETKNLVFNFYRSCNPDLKKPL